MGEVFKVAQSGYDVTQAPDADLLINSKYPLIKLDTANPVSFQTITFTFNKNPPEPTSPATDLTTIVYQFPHGYKYTPSFWALVQMLVTNPANNFNQLYFQGGGVLSANTDVDGATFTILADSTNIYFQVDKFLDSGLGGQPNNLVGIVLQIRLYVFVDDIGI